MTTRELAFHALVTVAVRPTLWHVFRGHQPNGAPIAPNAFFAGTGARFSLRNAVPARAMYYAGSTPAVALWESYPLREFDATRGSAVSLSAEEFADRFLVAVRPRRKLVIVDLAMPSLRQMLRKADIDAMEVLKVTPDHAQTHAAAAGIFARAAEDDVAIDGLRWRSKQHGNATAYLLYAPPLKAADLVLAEKPLSLGSGSAMAWQVIDSALALAKLTRITAYDTLGHEAPP